MRTHSPVTSRAVLAVKAVLTTGLVLGLFGGGLVAVRDSTAPAPADLEKVAYSPPRYRMVQANIKASMGTARFKKDVREVVGTAPDFITYNEVNGRRTADLEPGRYRVWRKGGDPYRSATAVAWDNDKWAAASKGIHQISNKRGKSADQRLHWGIRYANWVTLENRATGRNVSVVAVHFAPKSKYYGDLVRPSARALNVLVEALARRGPVMVGGDLNVQYDGSRYPRDIFDAQHLVPTFDVTQQTPVTHGQASTIDYVLARGIARFATGNQRAFGLESDHNAVRVDFSPLPVTSTEGSARTRFGPGVVVTDPGLSAADEQSVLRTVLKSINSAGRGHVVHLATRALTHGRVLRALKRAKSRGVDVQVVTAEQTTTDQMRSLQRVLGKDVHKASWAVRRPSGYDRAGLSATVLLVSRTGATPAFAFSSSTQMSASAGTGKRSGYISVTKASYDKLFKPFFSAVGRQV
ncbi:endonuclease/exonuclease/phosphatase family protein [Nocardioides sp. NPDC051685]|uniref:endonuclease/exonuclease/phosphatase family protein n=1 Tax=Nocardioides sp. NPDC051685 TaxID=3364334 RepID=UPI0037946CE7